MRAQSRRNCTTWCTQRYGSCCPHLKCVKHVRAQSGALETLGSKSTQLKLDSETQDEAIKKQRCLDGTVAKDAQSEEAPPAADSRTVRRNLKKRQRKTANEGGECGDTARNKSKDKPAPKRRKVNRRTRGSSGQDGPTAGAGDPEPSTRSSQASSNPSTDLQTEPPGRLDSLSELPEPQAGGSRPHSQDTTQIASDPADADDDDDDDAESTAWCWCRRELDSVMIACDNDGCSRRWFHMECVGLDRAPEGKQHKERLRRYLLAHTSVGCRCVCCRRGAGEFYCRDCNPDWLPAYRQTHPTPTPKPSRTRKRKGGWWCTVCDDHWNECRGRCGEVRSPASHGTTTNTVTKTLSASGSPARPACGPAKRPRCDAPTGSGDPIKGNESMHSCEMLWTFDRCHQEMPRAGACWSASRLRIPTFN